LDGVSNANPLQLLISASAQLHSLLVNLSLNSIPAVFHVSSIYNRTIPSTAAS
jgi:hypothetical protein